MWSQRSEFIVRVIVLAVTCRLTFGDLAMTRPTVTAQQVNDLLADLRSLYEADLRKSASVSDVTLKGSELDSVLTNPFDENTAESLDVDNEAEISAGLYEGDMILLPSETKQLRVAVNVDMFPARKWPGGIVPYFISPEYGQAEVTMIQQAIDIINTMTCVRLVPWNGTDKDFLVIWPVKKPAGCYAFVGRIGGAQIVSLHPPTSRSRACFISIGKPIHELLHSLGFYHEQSRSDRDRYVYVVDRHIVDRFKHNFDKQAVINTTTEYQYDYASVMHYGSHFFSKDRRLPTIIPRRNNTAIGQRNGLSVRDCLRVNSHYGCLERSRFDRFKYLALCRTLGVASDEY